MVICTRGDRMNGVIYARYSSDNQREESIEGQLRECRQYAERSGITIIDNYIDRALSAKTDNRPAFQKMIKDSASKQFDVIIVWKLDRFARNRYDSAHYKAQLRKNGVKVVSASESISEGAEGIILESVLEGMAEYYSAELAEKVIRGQTENALKCKFNGGTVTYGYKIDADRHFQIDEKAAAHILYIYNYYDSGMTMQEIADTLNNKGLRNAYGREFRITNISKILSNRRYIGEYRYRDIVIPDGIPAIISKELFDRVQIQIKKNKKAPARFGATEEYILSTKLYCGKCMSYMDGESGTNHSGNTYRYYKCISAKRKRGCDKKAVKKDWIERIVVENTIKALSNKEYVNQMIDSILEYQNTENTELPMLNSQLKKIDASINNMLNAIEQGIITDSTKQRLQDLEARRKEIQLSIVQQQISKPTYTREEIENFFEKAKFVDINKAKDRKFIADYFVNAVILHDDKLLLYLNYKKNGISIPINELSISSDTLCALPPAENRLFKRFFCILWHFLLIKP